MTAVNHSVLNAGVRTARTIRIRFMARSAPKKRTPIPTAVAAKVLFNSDRTCCVCRIPDRKIQIHHIDDDPSNNAPSNLAVLCLECHGETQITGGFGRRLDAEQVTLYRDDWHSIVARRRIQFYRDARDQIPEGEGRMTFLTSVIEQLRESGDYVLLAAIYDDLGNDELRDKYIDKALEDDSSEWLIISLRSMQGRQDLIPKDLADRRLEQQAEHKDWAQRARTLVKLGRPADATKDYIRYVLDSLEKDKIFTAAYYLKELYEAGLVGKLFERALQLAANEDDLWWQVRALQELGWDSELKELVLTNEERIKSSRNPLFLELFYRFKGDHDKADKLTIDFFTSAQRYGERYAIPPVSEELRKSLDEEPRSSRTDLNKPRPSRTRAAKRTGDSPPLEQ